MVPAFHKLVGNVGVLYLGDDLWNVWFWPHRGGNPTGGVMVDHDGRYTHLVPDGLMLSDDGCERLSPPNEAVRSLVASFGETQAVMPLIDALLEQYGETLAAHIQGVLS